MTIVDILREKAKTYELNAFALAEEGRGASGDHFLVASLVLYEVANAFEETTAIDFTSDHPQAA